MKQSWWFSLGESTWTIFVRLSLAGVFIDRLQTPLRAIGRKLDRDGITGNPD
jgi:hypothetical protein